MIDERVEVAVRSLQRRAHGAVRPGGPIGPLTTYRLGGPAGVLFEAATPSDLDALSEAVRETDLEVLVVGRGSNMLVSDRGFAGIAVRLGAGFRWASVDGDRLRAGAAMPLPALASHAFDARLAGLEFAVAIPASLGGAVRMNAGAHGGEMADVVESIEVYLLDGGGTVHLDKDAAGFAYRRSALPGSGIVTAATLALRPGSETEIAQRMRAARDWRRATQPLNLPNGGSVFKNPPGDHAARLVEQVGAKGMAVGAARVSEVHANFIVAERGARADEVYTLIRRVQRLVLERTGVELDPEIKLIGEFQEVGS